MTTEHYDSTVKSGGAPLAYHSSLDVETLETS